MKTFLLFTLLALTPQSQAHTSFLSLFKNAKPVIAAIMVELKDDSSSLATAIDWTQKQATIAESGGMDGLLIEFRGGGILDRPLSPLQIQRMVRLVQDVQKQHPSLVIGVEILWHFPGSTLLLAQQSGAKFVRVDFFSDDVIADKKVVPIDPKNLIQYKNKIGAENIFLLTDIQVKYSKMINPNQTIATSARVAEAHKSDGVIVSGDKSGTPPSPKKMKDVHQSGIKIPTLIGSGFSVDNGAQLLPHLDAIIVGTSISKKTGGPLLPEKVSELMALVKRFR